MVGGFGSLPFLEVIMTYYEVDSDRVRDLLDDLHGPVITEKLTKRNVLKLYPSVSTDLSRRSGMIQALHHLDLITDQERDNLKTYLENELNKFNSVLKVSKLFK